MKSHHFHAIVLKLQDILNDNDRRRLQFFLKSDAPRRFQDDLTLSETLSILEHKRQIQMNGINESIQSLTSILHCEQKEDKYVTHCRKSKQFLYVEYVQILTLKSSS